MLAAALVVVAAIVLALVRVHSGGGVSPATARHSIAPSTTPAAVPVGFSPESIAFADSLHGLMLGLVCRGDVCDGVAVATTDGGSSWHALPQAPPWPQSPPPHCLPNPAGCHFKPPAPKLVMLDDRVAIAYSDFGYATGGPPGVASHMYVTRDGGRSWAGETIRGSVAAIAGNAAHAYLLSSRCPPDMTSSATASCPRSVQVSTDLARTWRPAPSQPNLPDTYNAYVQLSAPSGGMVWVTYYPNTSSNAHFAVSADQGATWRSVDNPCTRRAETLEELASLGTEVWLICGHRPGFEKTQAWVSTDAGLSWTQRARPMSVDIAPLEFALSDADNGWTVAGSLAGGIGLALYHSPDGGRSWDAVASPPHASHVLFSDAMHGWAIEPATSDNGTATLWRTVDGGHTWTPVRLRRPA
jgi:photosystem II stability/assembly factor-like uncharacterized protein